MDLIRAIAKEIGREAEIQNLGFDGLISGLQAGNIDVAISGMSITPEREKNVLFSEPYYESGLTIVVKGDNKTIKGFNDLSGHIVAVQIGTTGAAEMRKLSGVTVKEFNTAPDCFMELQTGGAEAVVSDRPVNDYYIQKSGQAGVAALPEKMTAESYGIALAKNNAELQKEINTALQELHKNGEYDKIFAKWFGEKEK